MMEQHCASSRRLWIIEYAWAHRILEVFKDMEASFCSDKDWELLSLDESWRVRVASAQVFSIVRNRQISHYERVLAFLENTHTLLPTLVPAIKHMKITFGLKTMVIMWMLSKGAGPVDVVQKINKYFPRKLPQYQEHCRKHEMFLMRRNQLDFRTFAQSLIMDKEKLEDYIQNRVEEQYGNHYAQKTEERLLEYLQELDKVLPEGTYIDKIMRKNAAVQEAERALLDLITDDSKTVASTLRTLLHCDTAFRDMRPKSELGMRTSNYIAPESQVCFGASSDQTAAEKSAVTVGHVESPVTDTIMTDVDGEGQDRTVAMRTDRSKETACVGGEKTNTMAIEESCLKRGAHVVKVPAHFCSKHQCWVRNILCECPGESSEELSPQDSDISPPLFTSSSSDLTPSNLIAPPDCHQSPPAVSQLQEAEEADFVDKPVSQPRSHSAPTTVQAFIPGGAVNVVIVPGKAITTVTVCPLKTSAIVSDLSKDSNRDSTSTTISITAENPIHQTSTSPTPFISKLSRRFRLGHNYSQSQKTDRKEDGYKNAHRSPQTGFEIIDAASLLAHATSGMDISSNTSGSTDYRAGSPHSSTFKCSHMQPSVVLKRMSTEECLKATKRRSLEGQGDPEESSFDANSLYSSSSSEEDDLDTEYKPHRGTLRRWFLGY